MLSLTAADSESDTTFLFLYKYTCIRACVRSDHEVRGTRWVFFLKMWMLSVLTFLPSSLLSLPCVLITILTFLFLMCLSSIEVDVCVCVFLPPFFHHTIIIPRGSKCDGW